MVFYMRIIGTERNFRIQVTITMVIVWAWSATFLLCRPLKYNQDTTINGTCGDHNAMYVVAGTLNLITDIMVMILPLPHIWKLQLDAVEKIALCSVFGVGILVSIVSILRLKSLMDINFENITESVQMGVMWTIVEPELAIIYANMPVFKSILSTLAPTLFSTGRKEYHPQ
ncbi:hypothetical protein N7513_007294 [Penicillium frequentans]|nr:hypothetical protein N7513_007294 [Penicillium glabrum]